jgi:hypothetical protein
MYQNAQHQHQGSSHDCGQSWARGVRMLANYHNHTMHLFRSLHSCLRVEGTGLRVCEEVFHFEFTTVWLAELLARLILLLLLLLLLLLFLLLLLLRRRRATADVAAATVAAAAVAAVAVAACAAGAATHGSVSVKPIPVFIITFWAVPSTLCHVTFVLFQIALTIQIVVCESVAVRCVRAFFSAVQDRS